MANNQYTVKIGSSTYDVTAPNENTAWQWANMTHAAEAAPAATETKKKTGRSALRAGLSAAKSQLTTGVPYALEKRFGEVTPEEEASYQQRLQAQARRQEELLPGGPAQLGRDNLGRVITENLLYSAPQMGAGVAAGLAGSIAGGAAGIETGPGAFITALLGGTAAVSPFFVGSNVERATEGGEKALSKEAATRSLLTAPLQAAADVAAERFLPGVGKMMGRPARQLATGLVKRTAQGAAEGAIAEGITEPLQQLGERYAAGLPLANTEAAKEYGQAAATAALLGGTIGAGGIHLERAKQATPTGEPGPEGEAGAREKVDPDQYRARVAQYIAAGESVPDAYRKALEDDTAGNTGPIGEPVGGGPATGVPRARGRTAGRGPAGTPTPVGEAGVGATSGAPSGVDAGEGNVEPTLRPPPLTKKNLKKARTEIEAAVTVYADDLEKLHGVRDLTPVQTEAATAFRVRNPDLAPFRAVLETLGAPVTPAPTTTAAPAPATTPEAPKLSLKERTAIARTQVEEAATQLEGVTKKQISQAAVTLGRGVHPDATSALEAAIGKVAPVVEPVVPPVAEPVVPPVAEPVVPPVAEPVVPPEAVAEPVVPPVAEPVVPPATPIIPPETPPVGENQDGDEAEAREQARKAERKDTAQKQLLSQDIARANLNGPQRDQVTQAIRAGKSGDEIRALLSSLNAPPAETELSPEEVTAATAPTKEVTYPQVLETLKANEADIRPALSAQIKELVKTKARPAAELMDQVSALLSKQAFKYSAPRANQAGTTVEQVHQTAQKIASGWKADISVQSVQSVAELPADIQEQMRADSAEGAAGFVTSDGKTVYLIADNISSSGEAASVLYHEALGHLGLSALYKEQLDTVLEQIYKSNPTVRKEADAWLEANPDIYADAKDRAVRATEEILADRSRNGVLETSIFQRLAAVVRDFARRIGIKTAFSDAEVHAILRRAQNQIIQGGQTAGRGGLRYMFTGENAILSDQEYANLTKAKEMDSAGLDSTPAGNIRIATGWFKNPHDGKWRYETSDRFAILRTSLANLPMSFSGGKGTVTLGDVLEHPVLFGKYPDARKIKIRIENGASANGSFDLANNEIMISSRIAASAEKATSTLLHEIQHWVQAKEGFDSGGNLRSAFRAMRADQKYKAQAELVAGLDKIIAPIARQQSLIQSMRQDPDFMAFERDVKKGNLNLDAEAEVLQKYFGVSTGYDLSLADDTFWQDTTQKLRTKSVTKILQEYATELGKLRAERSGVKIGNPESMANAAEILNVEYTYYSRIAGEIEARNVQDRMEMSNYELRKETPLETETFDPNDVIITFANGKVLSLSIPANPNQSRATTVGTAASLMDKLRPLISTWTRRLNYKYQDAVDYTAQMAEALGLKKLPSDLDLAARIELLESRKSGGIQVLDRQFIKPLMEKIRDLKLDPQDIGMYLWARSAPARNRMVAAINSKFPDGGSGLTNAEAATVLQTLDAKGVTSKLEEIAKIHDKLVDHMLAERVKGGLLTQAQAAAIRAEQPFYTPLKGYALDGDMQEAEEPSVHDGKRARMGTKLNEYLRAEGRTSMPLNPLFNLMADAEYLVHRIETNRVGETFLNALMAAPDEHEQIATYYTDKQAKIRYKLDPESGDSVAIRENMRRLSKDEGLLVVKKGGQTYYVEFQPTTEGQALKRAFDNMQPKKLNAFMQKWAAVNNGVKSLLTRFNPAYLAGPAYLRDMQDAIATAYNSQGDKSSPGFGTKLGSKATKYIFTPAVTGAVARYVSGAQPKTAEEARMMTLLEQMVQDGGSVGHAMIRNAEQLADKATKDLKRYAAASKGNPLAHMDQARIALGNTLDAAAQGMDLQARFATYLAALDENLSREDAARLALNSSLNLTRRGEWSGITDNLFFFFSPTVESGRKLIKMGLTPKTGLKVMGTFVTMGVLSTLWNAMMSGDDDDDGRKDYLDVNPATRQTRLVLFYGHGPDDYVAIPLGFMMGFPKYMGERVTEAVLGVNSGEAASAAIMGATQDLAGAFATTLSPVRVAGEQAQQMIPVPSLVKPVIDLANNRNYFGSPIYNKQFDDRRARATMGRETTGRIYKWIATSINDMTGGSGTVSGVVDLQPEQYRYIVESFLGGPYKTGKDTVNLLSGGADEGPGGVPIIRGFVGKGSEYAPMNNYYRNTKRMDSILFAADNAEPDEWESKQSRFPLETDDRILGEYEAAKKDLDKLSRDRREELLDAADATERKDIIEYYRGLQNEVYTDFNRIFNDTKKELGK